MVLPKEFQDRMISIHGDNGKLWLDALPQILKDYSVDWNLTLQPTSFPISYNYVTSAIESSGTGVIIKAGVPCNELKSEIRALDFFDGNGMVRLLRSNSEHGVLCLEKVRPGTPVGELVLSGHDKEATSIVCRTVAAIHKQRLLVAADRAKFISVSDWGKGFDRLYMTFNGKAGPFDSRLVDAAAKIYGELVASTPKEILLHGDLLLSIRCLRRTSVR
jgi:streptomycin 6-kinase